eukprot:UN04482
MTKLLNKFSNRNNCRRLNKYNQLNNNNLVDVLLINKINRPPLCNRKNRAWRNNLLKVTKRSKLKRGRQLNRTANKYRLFDIKKSMDKQFNSELLKHIKLRTPYIALSDEFKSKMVPLTKNEIFVLRA